MHVIMTCHFGRLIPDQLERGFPVVFRWVGNIIGRFSALCGRREPITCQIGSSSNLKLPGTGHTQDRFSPYIT
jgi:hypothetical protein